MKLLYDGKKIGHIATNRSLTLEECFDLLDININEMEDENTPKWDCELFSMDYNKTPVAPMEMMAYAEAAATSEVMYKTNPICGHRELADDLAKDILGLDLQSDSPCVDCKRIGYIVGNAGVVSGQKTQLSAQATIDALEFIVDGDLDEAKEAVKKSLGQGYHVFVKDDKIIAYHVLVGESPSPPSPDTKNLEEMLKCYSKQFLFCKIEKSILKGIAFMVLSIIGRKI